MANKVTPEQVITFLRAQRGASGQPQYYSTFEGFYDRKLWHQLTESIHEFIKVGDFSEGDELLQLYNNFIIDFQSKINCLSLVQITIAAAQQFREPNASIAFLKSIADIVKDEKEPYVMASMEIASYQLGLGDLISCKKAIEESQVLLDSLPGVEPVIHACFYRVYAAFDQMRKNYAGFYKNSLLFLACVSLDSLSQEEKVRRTYDLGVAALLGDSIYNFGELLAHDILQVLRGTQYEWLIDLLGAFNSGDINYFQNSQNIIQQEKLLIENMAFLQMKIRLMCLIEIIFHLSADGRTLTFNAIAEKAALPHDQVEHLLMKAMSLKLVKGTIDQVDEVVHVSWVQPRVLDKNQITALKNRLDVWSQAVNNTIKSMENETPELFVQ